MSLRTNIQSLGAGLRDTVFGVGQKATNNSQNARNSRSNVRIITAGGNRTPTRMSDYAAYLNTINVPTVYAAVSVIAYTFANTKLRILDDNDNEINIKQEAPLLYELLEHPNPEMSGFIFREYIAMDWMLTGNSISALDNFNGLMQPTEMYRLRPDKVAIMRDPDKGRLLYGYQITTSAGISDMIWYLPDEIRHLKFANPKDPLWGLGVVESGEVVISAAKKIYEFKLAYFDRGAVLDGIITTDGDMEDDEYDRLLNRWQAMRGMRTSMRTGILWQGATYQPIQEPLGNVPIVDLSKLSRNDILEMFGVPPAKLGDFSDNNYSNAVQADMAFYNETISPLLTRAEPMWTSIAELFGPWHASYDRREFLDASVRAQTATSLGNIGAFTVDEIRLAAGHDPRGDAFGKRIVMQTMMTTVDPDNVIKQEQIQNQQAQTQAEQAKKQLSAPAPSSNTPPDTSASAPPKSLAPDGGDNQPQGTDFPDATAAPGGAGGDVAGAGGKSSGIGDKMVYAEESGPAGEGVNQPLSLHTLEEYVAIALDAAQYYYNEYDEDGQPTDRFREELVQALESELLQPLSYISVGGGFKDLQAMRDLPYGAQWKTIRDLPILVDRNGAILAGPHDWLGSMVADYTDDLQEATLNAFGSDKPHWAVLRNGTYVLTSRAPDDKMYVASVFPAEGQESDSEMLADASIALLTGQKHGIEGHYPPGHIPDDIRLIGFTGLTVGIKSGAWAELKPGQRWVTIEHQHVLLEHGGNIIDGPPGFVGKNVKDIKSPISTKIAPNDQWSPKTHWMKLDDGSHVLLVHDKGNESHIRSVITAEGHAADSHELIGVDAANLSEHGRSIEGHYPWGHVPNEIKPALRARVRKTGKPEGGVGIKEEIDSETNSSTESDELQVGQKASTRGSEETPPGSEWRTIHGAHILIDHGGNILEGPRAFHGKTVGQLRTALNTPREAAPSPTHAQSGNGTYSIEHNNKHVVIGGHTAEDRSYLKALPDDARNNVLDAREKKIRGIRGIDHHEPISNQEMASLKSGSRASSGLNADTHLAEDGNGNKYFVKQTDDKHYGPYDAMHEDMVYDLMHHFGLNVPAHRTIQSDDGTPSLVTRAVEGAKSSTESPLFVKDTLPKDGSTQEYRPPEKNEAVPLTSPQTNELTRQLLFDVLFNNTDAHSGNLLYTPHDGKFTSIDKAMAAEIPSTKQRPIADSLWAVHGANGAYIHRLKQGSATISRKTVQSFLKKVDTLDHRFDDRINALQDIRQDQMPVLKARDSSMDQEKGGALHPFVNGFHKRVQEFLDSLPPSSVRS